MQHAYRSLVGRDRAVTTAEFWSLTPCEVWLLIEARQEQTPEAKAEAEAQATRERAAEHKAEAEAAGFDSVAKHWRWRACHGC